MLAHAEQFNDDPTNSKKLMCVGKLVTTHLRDFVKHMWVLLDRDLSS
jgi:hypothetical protein